MARNNHFPRQKLPTSKKNKKWREKCVDAGENVALYSDAGVRRSYWNKKTNYNLYNDILDEYDIERASNPLGLKAPSAPGKMQNYPIANPKIDKLVGEEARMGANFTVRVANDSAISQKEEEKKQKLKEQIVEQIKKEAESPRDIKEQLDKKKKYLDTSFQDSREQRATYILEHLSRKLGLPAMFNEGFKDALIAAEEIYQADIIGGEPVLFKLDPLNVHTVRMGDSNKIEDSDIIVIDGYKSPGKVIDEYHDFLTEKQVEYIENNFMAGSAAGSGIDIGSQYPSIPIDDVIDTAQFETGKDFGGAFDSEGNVRVLKVYWRSLRKVKKVTSYDEDGDEVVDIVDENYKPKKEKGETAKTIWINEWWEGHKIGGDDAGDAIYTKMQIKPVQFREMENPSKCNPGIVGRVYNTNKGEGVSLMDRLKPFQYLYNIIKLRTENAISKSYGKIMELPLHKVPDDWELDKWMSFVHSANIAVTDYFKEGNKGAAQGKLAGNMQSTQNVWDLEMGNYIQIHIDLLQYLEKEMGDIAGVPEQREGQISERESVGNVRQSIVQSSHVTEYWFREHDRVKEECYKAILETAKAAWKGKNKKVQYVLDDKSTKIFNIDGDEFSENDYDIFISDSSKDHQILEDLKQLSHSMIQNDKASLSSIIDVYLSNSISNIRQNIEEEEEKNEERERRQMEEQRKQAMQEKQMENEIKNKELQLKKYETDLEAQVDREKMANERLITKLKEMSDAQKRDADSEESSAIDWEKVRQDWEKLENEREQMEQRSQLEEERLEIEKEKVKQDKQES